MSNYTTNAVVNLHINGQQPEQQLARLRENARLLSDAIAKAAAEGNKMELKKLRKELNQVNKDIRAIETASQQVDNVLRRMDSATPSELNKTLRTLQGQLEYIERGSVSWDQHVRKIQLVEREIANVKAQIKTAGDIVQTTLRNMNGASPHDLETTIRILEQDFKQMAAGAIQIAAIKKQQQASEAQGYAEGGYTPKGRKDQEVGVVHAGEWVASQELLANPEASAIIKTLDMAQSTGNMSVLKAAQSSAANSNTMGSLTPNDVTRSITAPQVLVSQNEQVMEQTRQLAAWSGSPKVVVQNMPTEQSGSIDKSTVADLSSTIASLNSRLNEPFVTVNTITGDQGIKKAQDEYARLIRNKTPKSRR